MMRYEHDFIYMIIPQLSHAIEDLTKELKRYNDNQEKNKSTDSTSNAKE